MGQEFLSQDEVDALLKDVSGEEDASPAEAPREAVRAYDLATQERIVRGRMPTLEVIHERFARLARNGIFGFMRKSPEIAVGPARFIKYSEFLRNLAVPTNLNLVALRPLRGNALVVIEPTLAHTVIDSLFGGDGRFRARVEGREFTATETRILQRLLAVLLEDYRRAWQPVHPIAFELLRSEMHTQFASIATPNEIVVTTAFTLEIGQGGGTVHVCIPYASVEPIRDKLFSGIAGEPNEPDSRWLRLLTQQVQAAEVQLVARLADLPVHVRQLLGMRAGDVIAFDLPQRVVAEVDGVPLFECRYGTLKGSYALKVEQVLAASVTEKTGESHAR